MDSRGQSISFEEAERRFAELKRRHDAGEITDEQFDEQRKALVVWDERDRPWAQSRSTGEWRYYDEDNEEWKPGTPPHRQQPPRSPWWYVAVFGSPAVLVVLIAVIYASVGGESGDGTTIASVPASPSVSANPSVSAGSSATGEPSFFVEENFDKASGVFEEYRENNYGYYYDNEDPADGKYHVYEANPSSYAFALADEADARQDVEVEVEAEVIGGKPENTNMGVICRARDHDNFYRLGVFQDGYAFISKVRNDESNELTGGFHTEAIGGNVTTPNIRARCVGSTLTLYVNGEKVEEHKDSTFESGKVGLFAGNAAEKPNSSKTEVLFDHFIAHDAFFIEENFDKASGFFPERRESDYGYYYDNEDPTDGKYHMYEERFDVNLSVLADEVNDHQDVELSVDAKVVGGQPEDTNMGIVCRARDYDNFYRLGVFQDGYAFISRIQNGELTTLTNGYHRDAIGGNLTDSNIRATCIGSTLTLYVNGKKVEQHKDSTFGSGKVGLFVGNSAKNPPTTEVLFDNFTAHDPT